MIRQQKTAKSRVIFSVVFGIASLGVMVDRASALTPFDLIQAPLNAVLGRQQPPPPTSRELHFGTDNLNGNNINLCALTCGPTGIPGITAPLGGRPPGAPAGMISGAPIPPGAGIPPGARPPFGAPGAPIPPGAGVPVPNPNAQRPNNPLLVLPPIQLPNPF
ncbi:MAG TPA: hypothetical protein V6D10_09470 [Trichocoleus sp.]